MAVRLFVGNLPYSTTEAELREHFSTVGKLASVYLPTDRTTGKPRGFAFIEFIEANEAQEAIRRFNNQPFKGRPLAINEARAREDSAPYGGGQRAPSSAPPRSFTPAPRATFEPDVVEPPSRGGASRASDASSRRSRKAPSRPQKGERVPKGPMRVRGGGQFFGMDDDEDNYNDDLDGDNFASREEDGAQSDDEDNY